MSSQVVACAAVVFCPLLFLFLSCRAFSDFLFLKTFFEANFWLWEHSLQQHVFRLMDHSLQKESLPSSP